MKTIPLFLTVFLAGCGATVLANNPRSVTIHAPAVGIAQAQANAECQKHNRYARLNPPTQPFIFTFDCVE